MIGQIISHYKILEKLGEGGMGVVYKAQDIKLDRMVALKFLPSYLDVNEEQTARFINEAKTASSIDHQNIGVIHEIGETERDDLFIAMAYYEGETLEKKIQNGHLSNEQAIDITRQIASGLAKAHERGIIHRDLKPANIIITKDGVAKIIDFGLAKLSAGTQLTRSGTSVGTPAFMSPEQARGESVDMTSDLWSLGAIMYQMATGKLPFAGDYEAIVLYKILNESPEPVKSLNPGVHPSYEAIIIKAMQKDPALRYRSADEIVKDLELHRTPVVLSQPQDTALPDLQKNYTLPRHYLWIASGVIAVAAIIFAWYQFNPFQNKQEYHSIMVLPIINQGDQLNEYLADGITKDIASRFSKNGNLRIISNRTSFLYKNQTQNNKSISESLNVNALIGGTLNVQSGQVNLVLNLYDRKRQSIVWSKEYQHSSATIVELVNQIIVDLSKELNTQLPDNNRLGTASSDIYDSYLRALYYAGKDRQSDNKLAMEYLAEIITKDTLFLPAILRMAEMMLVQYESGWDIHETILTEAQKFCIRALRADSNSSEALVILGRIQNLYGRLPEAMQYWQQAVEKDPKNTSAITLLAQTYLFNLNEPAKGVVYLRKLQDTDPTDWYNISNVGVGYGQLKDYPQAIYWFKQSIKLNPHNDLSWINLGWTMELSSKYDSAVECYGKALVENPANLTAYENAVSVLLAVGKFSSAESTLLPGANLLSNNHKFLYLKGITLAFNGKKRDAEQTFRDGLQLIDEKIRNNPNIAEYFLFKGLFNARIGNKTDAVAAAQRAAKLDSLNSETNILIARIFSILKEKQSTIEWFRRAKTMNPEFDTHYLSTALDFEEYRKDPDLLFAARQN